MTLVDLFLALFATIQLDIADNDSVLLASNQFCFISDSETDEMDWFCFLQPVSPRLHDFYMLRGQNY